MSTGVLTVEDVEGIRAGRIADPLMSQIAALAAAFGVPPSYLLDRGREPSVLDEEVLKALADERASAILREKRPPLRAGEGDCPRDSAAVRRPDRRCLAVAPLPVPVLCNLPYDFGKRRGEYYGRCGKRQLVQVR